jgi:anaerobic magnesium-protoporphyrin IX monomethyl ester cyclase
MKILLIYPRLKASPAVSVGAPLGILYIAAVLRREGHDVTFLDLTNLDTIPPLEPFIDGADLVGMSFSSVLAHRAFEIRGRIRQLRPDLPCVAGGPHTTALPEHSLQCGFDIAVLGEGEATIVELARALEEKGDLAGVKGIACMADNRLVTTEARPPIADLDSLPEPARDLVDWPAYYGRANIYDGIIASRGCPHRCLFCKPMLDRLFGTKLRNRSPRAILHEVISYRKIWDAHNPHAHRTMEEGAPPFFIMFLDDMFLSKPGWVRDFCDEIERWGLSFWWGCQSRVDALSEDLLARMKDAGCHLMVFGVESGSQRVLNFLHKDVKLDDTRRSFEICHRLGVATHAYMIIGSPEETRDDLEETYRLLQDIRPTTCYVARATPHPGSYLYQYAFDHGIMGIQQFDDQCDYYYNRRPLILPHLTEADLDEFEHKVKELFVNAIDLRVSRG